MRHALAIILLCLMPSVLAAKPALVRSGEHNGFTRLVIYVPEGSDWSLEKTDGQAVLNIENWTDGFNLSSVFLRIPKTRVADVSGTVSSVEISLGCDCSVVAETLPNGPVVIDISDDATQDTRSDRDEAFRLPTVIETKAPVLPFQISKATEPEPGLPDLSEFRRSLVDEVGRAASQLLLSPDVDVVPPSVIETPEEISSEPVQEEPTQTTPLESVSQIRTRSATDTSRFGTGAPDSASIRATCFSRSTFAIADWTTGEPFADQLGALRAELFEEFDTVDPSVALKLARLYLAFALTEEARVVAQQLLSDDGGTAQIALIADLLDDKSIQTTALRGQDHCSSEVKFWAFLADPENNPDARDIAVLLTTFAELPLELRLQIGPRLISRFQEADLPTEANIIRADILRSDPNSAPELAVSTGLELEAVSDEALTDMIKANDQRTPAALTALLDRQLESGALVDTDLVDLGFGLLRELDQTDAEEDLTHNLIKSQARNRQYFEAWNTVQERVSDEQAGTELRAFILSEALGSESGNSIAPLTLLALRDDVVPYLEDDMVLELSQKLISIGLPDLARDAASAKLNFDLDQETKALLALAAMDASQSKDMVENPDIPEAVRAELALRFGQSNPLLSQEAVSDAVHDRVAWEAQKYDLYKSDDVRGRVINRLETLNAEQPDEPSISYARSLTEQAGQTATDIVSLLSDQE